MTGGALAWARRHRRLSGAALALALAVAYVGALRPLRAAVAMDVALPAFEAIETPRAQGHALRASEGTRVVLAVPPDGDARTSPRWYAPAGAFFIGPAVLLAALFPFRPYWAVLLAYHIGAGVVAAALFALGLGWAEWAFSLHAFFQAYVVQPVSLAVPLLLWLAARSRAQPAALSAGSG